jgi:hypothetical protein
MSQYEIPQRPEMQAVSPSLIAKQPTMTKALQLCQTLSGMEDKAFTGPTGVVKDTAQWSRIMGSGQHNFPQDSLNLFMDKAQNEAPLLWLVQSRGYDINSLRKLESETEHALRQERELRLKTEEKLRYAESLLKGRL